MFKQTIFDNSPPASGEIHMLLPIAPVSLQASRSKKNLVTNTIRSITKTAPFILTGDVQINIEWRIHEQTRYESDTSPDVDNIIKPIFDALCGSEGILIDDCQIQALDCRWIDWTRYDQEILIFIRFFEEYEWYRKDRLVFVHLGKGLCVPIYKNKPCEFLGSDLNWYELIKEKLNMYEKLLQKRDDKLQQGWDYYHAKQMMFSQRLFHRSRINEFQVFELDTLREEINLKIQSI